ncbi:hypothetical protein scyTo_0020695, partial [Scyliorhinus torazame]|nr:hypothetical protein [Scyliorhinus torazame]
MGVRRTFSSVYLIAWCLVPLSSSNQPDCDFDSGATWIPFGSKWFSFISTPGNGIKMNKAQEMCKDSGT